jgi:hypothetical protein
MGVTFLIDVYKLQPQDIPAKRHKNIHVCISSPFYLGFSVNPDLLGSASLDHAGIVAMPDPIPNAANPPLEGVGALPNHPRTLPPS